MLPDSSLTENISPLTTMSPSCSTLKIVLATIAGLAAFFVVAGLVFIYSGTFDITATTPHSDAMYKTMLVVREQSIKSMAHDVKVPELDDPERVHAGFLNFNAMCVTCHNAPGAAPTEISKGLYPEAPNLAQSVKGRTAAELYMIIKHGIKMSGMPAWEPSHSGEEIWSMVAFMKTLPSMSDEEYQGAVKYYEAAGKNAEMHH